jgi:hypothetical protein
MTVSERVHRQDVADEARTRSFVLPGALAVVLFATIAFIQFSLVLGKYGFFAELPLGIGFYYCWAWHKSLSAKADVKQRAVGRA